MHIIAAIAPITIAVYVIGKFVDWDGASVELLVVVGVIDQLLDTKR